MGVIKDHANLIIGAILYKIYKCCKYYLGDKTSKKMLDDSSLAKEYLEDIKGRLYDFMHYKGDDMKEEFVRRFKEQPP